MKVKLTLQQKSTSITSSPLIALIMQDILKSDGPFGNKQEHFWVVGLDHYNKVQFVELVALGAYNRVNIDSTDVFRLAVLKSSNRVILVHNHPGNSLEPSDDDKNATDCLVKAGEMLKIDVIDHLIITENDYLSFADEGLIDEIKARDTYRLLDKEKVESLQSGFLEEGKNAEKLKTAKTMKQVGIENELIIQITGLEPSVVQEL
jgi:DNA repair protein RadC